MILGDIREQTVHRPPFTVRRLPFTVRRYFKNES